MAESAPSVQIAAAMRERIAAGELRPGDRVPSTRALMREWGVAMATATKALTMLRLEGLVRPMPGVGTVVAGPAPARPRPGSRPRTDRTLTVEVVVATAVRVADAEGLAGLSMRRVANALGLATMSLYRHVTDKDDLVVRMVDAALGEWEPPHPPPHGWRARLEVAATALWAAFRAHPWLVSALSLFRPQPIARGMVYTEWCLSALSEHGLDLQQAFDLQMIMYNFVRGVAMNIEAEADAQAMTGLDAEEWMLTQQPAMRAILDSGDYPTLSRMIDGEYDLDVDQLFRTGLQFLLDGMAARIGSQA